MPNGYAKHLGASTEAPDDFEPFQVKEERRTQPRIPLRAEIGPLTLARLQLELPSAATTKLQQLLKKRTFDFGDEDLRAPGRALVSVVSVRTGEVEHQSRDLLEDMRIACGRFLQEQIRAASKGCLNSLNPAVFTTPRLTKTACYGSPALEHYKQVALELVTEYENHVCLGLLADPDERLYTVGAYQPSGPVMRDFSSSGHAKYDTKSFNSDELELAKALDKFDLTWVRNKDRLDYGIPLPLKSANSSTFYPDFLWWVNGTVWAIDPTGKHILNDKIRSKLLSVPGPLKIAPVTRGTLDGGFKWVAEEGWTLVRIRMGNPAPETFEFLSELLESLRSASLEVMTGRDPHA